MSSILGSKSERKVGKLLSASYVKLRLGGGDNISFGAGAQGQNSRPIMPTELFGNDVIHYTIGASQGEVSVSTVVGDKGFFEGMRQQSPCDLQPISVKTSSNPCATAGTDSFKIRDALLQSIGFSWQAGPTPVSNSASFMFGTIEQ